MGSAAYKATQAVNITGGIAEIERWPGKTAHRDKWIFCLTAARMAA